MAWRWLKNQYRIRTDDFLYHWRLWTYSLTGFWLNFLKLILPKRIWLFFVFLHFPESIPFEKRFTHQLTFAKSGWGKTQLLLQQIFSDLKKCQKGKGGLLVMDSDDSPGGLINTLLQLSIFDPKIKKSLAEKLILVDAEDVLHPIALNPFDIKLDRISDPVAKESAMNAAVALFGDMFAELMKSGDESSKSSGMTRLQKNIFIYSAKLLLQLPGSNINTFVDLLKNGEQYRDFFVLLDPNERDFMENDFFSTKAKQTKGQVLDRLRALLSHSTLRRILTAKESKIDLYEAMATGKVVFVKTSKNVLQEEGCRLF